MARSREITELREELDRLEIKLKAQKVICQDFEADKLDLNDRLVNLSN